MSIQRIKKVFCLMLTLMLLTTGCAGTQTLSFYSNTEVNIDANGTECVAPCQVDIKRESNLILSVSKDDKKIDTEYKSSVSLPKLPKLEDVKLLVSLPILIFILTIGTHWEYNINDIYIYVLNDNIIVYDIERSVFAFALNYYAELSNQSDSSYKERLKELSKLSELDAEHISMRLEQTKNAEAFADIISKDALSKIVNKNYKSVKKKTDNYIANFSDELRLDKSVVREMIAQSSDADAFLFLLYNYELIQRAENYASNHYSDIISEYREGGGAHMSALSELTGLSAGDLCVIIELTDDKDSFTEKVISEMQRCLSDDYSKLLQAEYCGQQ